MEIATRRQLFEAAISPAPEIVRLRYMRDFAGITFIDDADFYAYLDEIKPDIEAMQRSATAAALAERIAEPDNRPSAILNPEVLKQQPPGAILNPLQK